MSAEDWARCRRMLTGRTDPCPELATVIVVPLRDTDGCGFLLERCERHALDATLWPPRPETPRP